MVTLKSLQTWRLREWSPWLQGVILALVTSKIAFYLAAGMAFWLMPLPANEPAYIEVNSGRLIALHWRWDAIHYYNIATQGYQGIGQTAFFPLLPLLIRGGSWALEGFQAAPAVAIDQASRWPLAVGILIPLVALVIALACLWHLSYADTNDEATAHRAVLYTAIFPFAFYYNVPYTEALLLAAAAGMFLAARRGHWVLAGLCAALGTAMRPTGLALLPALFVEGVLALRQQPRNLRLWGSIGSALVIAPLGIASYMLYGKLAFDDPQMFIHAQQQSDWARTEMKPWEALEAGLHYAFNPELSPTAAIYGRGLINTVFVVGSLVMIIVSLRHWRLSYSMFGLALLTLILVSPFPDELVMHGLGRYTMLIFPVFLRLAEWGRRPTANHAIQAMSLPLYGVFTALYVGWYPVA